MGIRTRADWGHDTADDGDSIMPAKRGRVTGATHMRMAMGAGAGSRGGPSVVAQGQSDSAYATRAAVHKKMPKFFEWLESLPEQDEYAVAKIFIPADRDWTKLSTDHMIDRR